MKSATWFRLYSVSAACLLRCLSQKNRPATIDITATTPTTTPAAIGAMLVEPPESDSAVGDAELVDSTEAGLVITMVLPGDTLVTTVGGAVVVGALLTGLAVGRGRRVGCGPCGSGFVSEGEPEFERPPPKFTTLSSVPVK